MPKVSIIVPTYNVEQYLEECMDSIVNQTLEDIEVICVDDGSTDNSGKILDKYAKKDKRIKVIHKENGGYGKAMNIGIDNAKGEYIGIVEPDDFVALDMYETLYNKAKELDLDLIKADFNRFTGNKPNYVLMYNRLDKSMKFYNQVINCQKDVSPFHFIMNTWSGIYKRDFIKKHNIRHNETPGASFQDNGFWFQTFMFADKMYFMDKPYYMNRRDNPNSSVKNRGKVFALKAEYDFIRNIIESKKMLRNKFLGIYHVMKYRNYCFNLNRIDKSFKKEFLKTFTKEFIEAYKNNEIDETLFSAQEVKNLHMICKKPMKFYRHLLNKPSFIQKIFSVTSHKSHDNKWHRIIWVLGIRISFRSRRKETEEKLNCLLRQNIQQEFNRKLERLNSDLKKA